MHIYYKEMTKEIVATSHGLMPSMSHLSVIEVETETADISLMLIKEDGSFHYKTELPVEFMLQMQTIKFTAGVTETVAIEDGFLVTVDDSFGGLNTELTAGGTIDFLFQESGEYLITFAHPNHITFEVEVNVL